MPRWLLLALLLLPTAVAAQAPPPAAVQAGPMLGHSDLRAVTVWVQTTQPAQVQVRYWPVDDASAPTLSPPVAATEASGHTAHLELFGLKPGRRYGYDLVLDGEPVPPAHPQTFQTQPLWHWRADPPTFTVAIGSCAYINEAPYDRPGAPYGDELRIFRSIDALQPDLMLWLGDNVYFREVDWGTPAGLDHRYAHDRAVAELQPLLARTHHYAIWDDHDYGPNDADRSYPLKGAALDLFQRYWANPSYGLPEVPGLFTQFAWGDVEFFLLDDRYHRSPSNAPPDSHKVMYGDAQMQWLVDALTASKATFKLVAGGSQFLNEKPGAENWSAFPFERDRLLAALEARQIGGVVFLSGDRHFTELLRLERPGTYPLYDFTSSPVTSGSGRGDADQPDRVPGTLIEQQRNFGTLTFSGPCNDRVLTMRAYDSDGGLRWEHAVRASEVHAPGFTGHGSCPRR